MSTVEFVRRVVLGVALTLLLIGAGMLLLNHAGYVLLVFGGILLAIVLESAARQLSDRFPIPRGVALSVIAGLLLTFLGVMSWLAGPPVVDQTVELTRRIPAVLSDLKVDMEESELGRTVVDFVGTPQRVLPDRSDILSRITGIFSTALSSVTNILIILFIGIYLAADPGPYVSGFVRLFPSDRRENVRRTLGELGRALTWWTVGRISSMAVVGVLTAVGLAVIGAPLPLALGFIAGLLSFVPFLGPVVAAVPAVLIGLARSPTMALWVLLVYVGVQSLESYVVTPMIQRRAVHLPPALLIGGQVLMGVLAGVIGVFFATPVIVAVTVVIQSLYLRGVLGEEVRVLGEHGAGELGRGAEA